MTDRIKRLQNSVRKYRAISSVLGILVLLLGLVAWRGDPEVRAQRFVLLDTEGNPGLILEAGEKDQEAALVIKDAQGREVMRLGGPPVRRIGPVR